MKTVVVLITCDTKPDEAAYIKMRLGQMGVQGLVADTGTSGVPGYEADITRQELAELGSIPFAEITDAGTRGGAVGKMADALMTALPRLHEEGRLDGVLCVGGAGAFIGAPAMQSLPLGVPKVVVSPLASGMRQLAPFVGSSDVMVMHSVIDIAGMNDISRKIYDNAAAAVAGMVLSQERFDRIEDDRKYIGVTMMGTTTPGAMAAVSVLEKAGYGCVIFHASGVGGSSMEKLAREGALAGVLEFSLAEMMGTHVKGFTKTKPERLSVVGECGIPQVVAVSAIDFINLFPHETAEHADRIIYNHNPQTPLMRANKEEMLIVAKKITEQLGKGKGRTTVVAPLRGFSDPNREGGLFWDPESDDAFRKKLRSELKEGIKYVEIDAWVNDKAFGETAANELLAIL
ncbi:MAG: Tm-1-like ATP-binding domain-containing protein [Clostridiales bacterium]|nr:Tm-1-like ATP-binding domain-containing protein [Clostridiales bacterium]